MSFQWPTLNFVKSFTCNLYLLYLRNLYSNQRQSKPEPKPIKQAPAHKKSPAKDIPKAPGQFQDCKIIPVLVDENENLQNDSISATVINVQNSNEVKIFGSEFKPLARIDQQSLLDSQDLGNLSELMSNREQNNHELSDGANGIESREDELNQTPLGKVNDFFKQIKFD